MKVWIYDNGVQQGPYSLEQAKMYPLRPSTPVWYEGLPKWIPASESPLFADRFGGVADGESAQAENPYGESSRSGPIYSGQGHSGTHYAGSQNYGMGAGMGPETIQDVPPRPKSRIVWCIILTVLCCSPFGIAGLFTGSSATQRYDRGDYAGAARMSEATEWMVILGIVWALVGLPVMMAFSM